MIRLSGTLSDDELRNNVEDNMDIAVWDTVWLHIKRNVRNDILNTIKMLGRLATKNTKEQ
jgi:hypothetical protein